MLLFSENLDRYLSVKTVTYFNKIIKENLPTNVGQ